MRRTISFDAPARPRLLPSPLGIIAALAMIGGCATTQNDTAMLGPQPVTATDAAEDPAPKARRSLFSRSANETPVAAAAPAAPAEHADLWERIRDGLHLAPLENDHLIERHEQWFARNPQYMANMVERARLYLYYIVDEVEKRGMPMEIALLPAIESAYQPHAYSRARAVGLWQFIPSTGRLYGLKANWWYDGRRDVMASTQAALDYLEKLNKDFNGDWHLALAAYNCGEGRVARLMAQNAREGKPTGYEHLALPRETRNYVPKLIAIVNIVSDPEKYNLALASIPNEPYFAKVDAGSQIDLGVIARLADMPVDELYRINPAYRQWITDPNGPHHLLVPADKKEVLIAGLSALPETERVKWGHHSVRRGDTLSEISRRYGVSVEAIKTANNLRGSLLRVGQDLLIPVSASRSALARAPHAQRVAASSSGKVKVVHRVRSGDTLWSIARRYNVAVHQLRQWNSMGVNDILRSGRRLHIWTNPGPSAGLAVSGPS
jgi:membrane-bound lytic murein transglycosylase D